MINKSKKVKRKVKVIKQLSEMNKQLKVKINKKKQRRLK